MIKEKNNLLSFVCILFVCFLFFGMAACGSNKKLNNEAKNNIIDEQYNSNCLQPHADNVKIDGILDEKIWENKKWYNLKYLSDFSNKLPKVKTTGYLDKYGIYIASEVTDSNLVHSGEHSNIKNSNWEFYITADPADKERPGDALYRYKFNIDMLGYVLSQNTNFARAVKYQGELNSGQSVGATLEMFIPWQILNIDASTTVPKGFRALIGYLPMLEGQTNTTYMVGPNYNYNQTLDYYRFDQNGYVQADRDDAIIGDAINGYPKSGNWDVSRENEGIVESLYGTEHHKIYFKEYDTNFILETTIIPVKTLENDWPKSGVIFTAANGKHHALLIDFKDLIDGVNGTKNINQIRLTTLDNYYKRWNQIQLSDYDRPNEKVLSQEGLRVCIVKQNGKFWYFINNEFYTCREYSFMDCKVIPGFYALGNDSIYKDYTCKVASEQEIERYLLDRNVYSINVEHNDGGIVSTSVFSALAGDSYNFTVTCEDGNEIEYIKLNDEDITLDAIENSENGKYIVKNISSNQNIEVSFKKVDNSCLSGNVVLNGENIDATLQINGITNKMLHYEVYASNRKGYSVNIPNGDYEIKISSDATDAITFSRFIVTVDGQTTKDFEIEESLFANKVMVNDVILQSPLDKWDLSQLDCNIVCGSFSRGTVYNPLLLNKTGSKVLLQTTIEYTTLITETGTYQPDLMGGFSIYDGKNTGYVWAVNTGVVHTGWKFKQGLIKDAVLMKETQRPVILGLIIDSDKVYVFLNNEFVSEFALSAIMPNSEVGTEFAYAIAMKADYTSDIRFSETSITTNEDKIADYLSEKLPQEKPLAENPLFAETLVVNDVILNSSKDNWDLSQISDNVAMGSTNLGTQYKSLYFNKTGKYALLETKIEYTSVISAEDMDKYQNDLFGGFYIHDGTNSGYVWAINKGVVVTGSKYDQTLLKEPVLMRDSQRPVTLTLAITEETIYVFLNKVFARTYALSEVMPKSEAGCDFAFALSMKTDKLADIRFSEFSCSTDETEVRAYVEGYIPVIAPLSANPMFANGVEVNGKELYSDIRNWDLSQISDNVAMGSTNLGTQYKSLYFNKTGKYALLETKIEYTSVISAEDMDKYQNDLFGGFYIHDGTNSGYVWAINKGVVVTGNKFDQTLLEEPVLMRDSQRPVTLTLAITEETVYVFLNKVFARTYALSEVMPKSEAGCDFAFALSMKTDKLADIRFSEFSCSTDETEVKAYINTNVPMIAPLSANPMFANGVEVNGKELYSDIRNWDLSQISDNVAMGSTNLGTQYKSLYFNKTGKYALLETKIEYTSVISAENMDKYQNDLFGGFYIHDGTNSGYVWAINKGVVVTGDKFDQTLLKEPVLMRDSQRPVTLTLAITEETVYVFLNKVFARTYALSEVMPKSEAGCDFAFALSMKTDKLADIRFSEFSCSTDETEVKAYINTNVPMTDEAMVSNVMLENQVFINKSSKED